MRQKTQETSVSVHAEINSAGDLLGIPLPVPGMSNKNLKVGDVAYAFDSHVEPTSISHYNGQPRVYIELGRSISSDEITATKIAREQLKKIEAQFPDITFSEIDAPADYTLKSLNGVWQSLLEGIALTMIVMLLFLHAWRNAIVIMIAIPSSILATFVLMILLGFHLDIMSLMGLVVDHRYPGGRLDRRAGKHHAPSRPRGRPGGRGDQRPHRDRRSGDRDHHGRRRGLPSDRVLAGHRWGVSSRVRHGNRHRNAILAAGLVHAHAAARSAVEHPRALGTSAEVDGRARKLEGRADPRRRRARDVPDTVAGDGPARDPADHDHRGAGAQRLRPALRSDSQLVPVGCAAVRARPRTLRRVRLHGAIDQRANAGRGRRDVDHHDRRADPRARGRVARRRLRAASQDSGGQHRVPVVAFDQRALRGADGSRACRSTRSGTRRASSCAGSIRPGAAAA